MVSLAITGVAFVDMLHVNGIKDITATLKIHRLIPFVNSFISLSAIDNNLY